MSDQQKMFEKMRAMTEQLMTKGPQAATAAIQAALLQATAMSGLTRPGTNGEPVEAAGSGVLRDINPPPAGKESPEISSSSQADATGMPTSGKSHGAVEAPTSTVTVSALGAGMIADFVPGLLAKLGVPSSGMAGFKPSKMAASVPLPDGAQFLTGSYANTAGSRQYKLYVPACYQGQALPLVVMLHGCTQDPDDFAAGTQMNEAAELHRCLVLYPQQSTSANSSKCWNWFSVADQKREAGEPSIIAGMTQEVAARFKVDRQQIFIAGLSAGGAMAAIMGAAYPDLYAGVAVHSGLAVGAAADLPSALAAMKSGAAGAATFKGIPIIVFHGDADHTVNVRNGAQVMAQSAPVTSAASNPTREKGQVANGHAYTRTVHRDRSGNPVAEHWLIHGFGHAWAGGSAGGSYTDPRGPNATAEMMRFFYTQGEPV